MCVFVVFTLLDLEPPFDYSMFAFSAPSLLGLCLFILFSLSLFTLPCLDLSMSFSSCASDRRKTQPVYHLSFSHQSIGVHHTGNPYLFCVCAFFFRRHLCNFVMPAYESRHLLRVLDSPQVLAKSFIGYCKRHHVTTRGLCRIGYARRTPPPNAASQSQSPDNYILRGLIANKDIAQNENIVMMPVTACLHPGVAFRCKPFWDLLPAEARVPLQDLKGAYNTRLADRSLVRHNQYLLALYMVYLMLLRSCDPARLASTPGGDVMDYIDFMPRNEGNFDQLAAHLSGWLDAPEVCRTSQAALATHFELTQAEVRPAIVYALCMIYSRMVPVDHRACLQYAFQSTPYASAWDNVAATAALATLPPNVAASASASGAECHESNSGRANTSLVREPISFLCPVIDMCNHSENENVAVMVPDREPTPGGPIICLRSLRPIPKGEELVMTYGAAPHELKLIWGMQDILQ